MIRQAHPQPNDLVIEYIKEVLDSGNYVKGPKGKLLEEKFQQISGCKYNYAVNSGTSALNLIMHALDYPLGSEIIVPVNTFLATSNAVELTGYNSIFVDIDPNTMNIDPKKIEDKISEKTKAIVVVHLYGSPAPMDEIISIAERHNLDVIEDCAQAHGALYKNKKVGSIGKISAFSLFPTKNFTVLGDGGMVSTNDKDLGQKIAMLRNAGRKDKPDDAEIFGFNFRLSEVMAAIGLAMITDFDKQTKRRQEIASIYENQLKDIPEIILPQTLPNTSGVFHQYTIRTDKRDELKEFLKQNDIQSSIKYGIPLHLVTAYKRKYNLNEGHYPEGERAAKTLLCLPMHPFLTNDEVEYVTSKIKEFFNA